MFDVNGLRRLDSFLLVSSVYVYIWEYVVSPGRVEEFIEMYGPGGPWVRLFDGAPGYLGTDLLRDRVNCNRFLTVDRWESVEAFAGSRARSEYQFAHLDRLGEELTLEETQIGEFQSFAE